MASKMTGSSASSVSSVSSELPDWSRERYRPFSWNPPRALLKSIRAYQAASGPFAALRRASAVLRHRFWSAVTGADIPLNSRIGGGLLIPHPNGIVIHPDAKIGYNCLFFQQVTIGATQAGIPKIGGHVDIGAGAKIIGPVSVGDHARIGANAVVLINVPPHGVAVGNPARLVSKNDA
jgi:serine O-acetyltransferase